jgi:diketogulonate reductase-like aldo/keto reductase
MERRILKNPTQVIPVIGQGTWNMERDGRGAAVAALRRGIDLGMTHIDTAEMYGSGRVEEIVGEAIRGLRDQVFLVSKVLPSNATFQGARQACERSLKRLQTDHLDCYLLHWPGSYPLEETFRAFVSLMKEGKIGSFGVSNFDVRGMEEAVRLTKLIVCNQVLYNLEERTIEHALIPWHERHGIPVVAYSPLGAQKFHSTNALEEVAAAHRATPRQIALAFLIRNPNLFAIPKSSVVAHVEENAAAAEIRLSPEDLRKIDAAFPRKPWRGLAMA